jgi:uncharacterized OB-fold protein
VSGAGAVPGRPIPVVTPEMAPFWAAAKRGQLVVQRCRSCGALRFPAREVCSRCLSRDVEWTPVSGRGEVFSTAIMHQANHPAFAAVAPYAVVVIQLEEGVRMMSNVVECAVRDVRIGMPVEVVFQELDADVTLPLFRPAPATPSRNV